MNDMDYVCLPCFAWYSAQQNVEGVCDGDSSKSVDSLIVKKMFIIIYQFTTKLRDVAGIHR